MTNSMFWVEHPEADHVMRKMFEEGCTMSQIGAAIGCSRNAVIGRMHRLRLARADVRRRAAPSARSPRPKPPPKPLLVEFVDPTTLAPRPWVVGQARRQIIELRSDECRRPINEPDEDFCFCAEPQAWGSSYCPYHHRLSYVPARGRQRQ